MRVLDRMGMGANVTGLPEGREVFQNQIPGWTSKTQWPRRLEGGRRIFERL